MDFTQSRKKVVKMAQAYKNAMEHTVLLNDEPMNDRVFQLILINPNVVKFNAKHADVASIFEEDVKDGAQKAERVALRTQVINNPLTPVQIGTKILQFFAVNPNQDELINGRNAAVLVEIDETGSEAPLFYLNRDEVWNIAHGEGFATTLFLEAFAPSTPA